MIQQVDDFRAEAAELHRLLAGIGDSDWTRPTQFKAWTIDDIVRHLHMGDTMALASASDPAEFTALMADIKAERAKGLSRIEETRLRLHGLAGRPLLERWHETAERRVEADGRRNGGHGQAAIAVGPAEGADTDLGDVAQTR